jgi:hypothetical protein
MYNFDIEKIRTIRKPEPARTSTKGRSNGPFMRPVELSTKQLYHYRVRCKKGGHAPKNYYVQIPLGEGKTDRDALAVVMKLFKPFYQRIDIVEINKEEYLNKTEDECNQEQAVGAI